MKRKPKGFVRIHVNDDLPKIGTGVRWVRIVRAGWKWTTIEDRLGRRQKVATRKWEGLVNG